MKVFEFIRTIDKKSFYRITINADRPYIYMHNEEVINNIRKFKDNCPAAMNNIKKIELETCNYDGWVDIIIYTK